MTYSAMYFLGFGVMFGFLFLAVLIMDSSDNLAPFFFAMSVICLMFIAPRLVKKEEKDREE